MRFLDIFEAVAPTHNRRSLRRVWWPLAGIAAAILFAARVHGIPRSPTSENSTPDLARVAEWVLATGAPTVVRANVATKLGLPNSDLAVTQRALRPLGSTITEVFAVPHTSRDLAVVARTDESTGASFVWLASASRGIQAAVSIDQILGVQRVERGAEQSAVFARSVAFFFARARADASPSVPTAAEDNMRPPSPPAAWPTPAFSLPSNQRPFASETAALFAAPWVVPVIIGTLYFAAQPVRRRRN